MRVNDAHGEVLKDKQQKILNASDLGTWALSQFSNVSELKKALLTQKIWLGPVPAIGEKEAPFHYAFFDRNGNGLVLEFVNGKEYMYYNSVHVMTNSPDFSWQLTNLDNYAFISNVAKVNQPFGEYTAKAIDIGGNLAGLPSEDTSVARFVRAAYYAQFAQKPNQSADGIVTIGKIMNKFDRIKGITARDDSKSNSGSTVKSISSEWTLFTSIRDLNNSTYYLRTDQGINYVKIDLNQIKNSNQVKSISLTKLPTTDNVTDISCKYSD